MLIWAQQQLTEKVAFPQIKDLTTAALVLSNSSDSVSMETDEPSLPVGA
jgi:hypothetical protein